MRIAVAGAGAMGTIFAVALIDAGNSVLLVDNDVDLVAQVRREGAEIVEPDGQKRRIAIDITDAPDPEDVSDAALFFVKGYQTERAAALVAPLIGATTTLVTLQNGIGNEDTLRAAFPENEIVVGNSVHSGTVTSPGVVHHTGVQPTYVGPDATASPESVAKVAAALDGSGFAVQVLDRQGIINQRWSKLVMNCATLPVGALTGLDTEPLGRFEPVAWLMDALVRESCAVARLEGVELDADERISYTRDLLASAGGRGSMLQDLLKGRRTEIDTINGAIVKAAQAHGVEAPWNKAMTSLVKGREEAAGGGGKLC